MPFFGGGWGGKKEEEMKIVSVFAVLSVESGISQFILLLK